MWWFPLALAAEIQVTADTWPTAEITADPDALVSSADGHGQQFGGSVALVQDFDGDGLPELAVGAPYTDVITGKPELGEDDFGALVLVGADALGPGAVLAEADLPHALGPHGTALVGNHLADLGDLDGDGLSELAVGAVGWDGYHGAVYVLRGQHAPWAADTFLEDLAGVALIGGVPDNSKLGNLFSVCDLDRDGTTDLVVAAQESFGELSEEDALGSGYDPSIFDAGTLFHFADVAGRLGGGEALWSWDWPPARTFVGDLSNGELGTGLACGGDFDGDGAADLAATTSCGCADTPSAVFLWRGGDPLPASGTASETAHVHLAWAAGEDDTRAIVGPAGDFDGDGIADLAVGLPGYPLCEAEHPGAVAVLPGGDDLLALGTAVHDPIDVATTVLCGERNDAWLGRALVSNGDLNGDGFDDLVIGEVNTDTGRKNRAYIVYGRPGGLPTGTWPITTLADHELSLWVDGEEKKSQYFSRRMAVGDLDLDGVDDLVISARRLVGEDGTSRRGGVWVLYGRQDLDRDGWFAASRGGGDCDDDDPSAHPGATETAGDGLDSDCDGFDGQEGAGACPGGEGDCDQDGDPDDCRDDDLRARHGASEVRNALDDDCDGLVDEGTAAWDGDGDGFSTEAGDCDDSDPELNPGAEEGTETDGRNQDCDLKTDERTLGRDDDGDGLSEQDGDCDDTARGVSPELAEVCDEADTDCDGEVDEGVLIRQYPDHDGDGAGRSEDAVDACGELSGHALVGGDCDDGDPEVGPHAEELWYDGVDDDCDGNDGDFDGDGYTREGYAFDDPEGRPSGDCDDQDPEEHPGSEGLDTADRDCNGEPDVLHRTGPGCATAGAGAPGAWLLLLLLLRSRRDPRATRAAAPRS